MGLLLSVCASERLSAQCPDGSPPPCARAAAGPGARSVAVLNFRLLSRDSSDAYLAEGLADAVTSRLSQVERLEVASRTAARLGRTPRAAYIVSGTMLRQNARLIVNVELLRASTGRNAWAQRYERPDTAVLDLERDIAVAVASAVLPSVTAAERSRLGVGPTRHPEAYDRLLRGDFLLARRTPASTAAAIREYEAAVRLEPALATAHAKIGLASAIWMDWEWDPAGRPPPDSVLRKGVLAAARALELDSMSSDAWLARAYLDVFAKPRTFEGVEAAYRRAIELDPRNAEAHHQYADWLSVAARGREGIPHLRAALAIDPARPVTLRNLASELGNSGDSSNSLALADSSVRLEPDQFANYNRRAWLRLAARDTAGARSDMEMAVRLAPPEVRLVTEANLALVLNAVGDSTAALAALDRAQSALAPAGPLGTRTVFIGRALFVLGRVDAAFRTLERIQPRGAQIWFSIMEDRTDLSPLPERIRRVLEEARPAWIR